MATQYRERAQILIDQRRYDLAANELRSHLASEPDDPYARSLLARCLARQKKPKEALAEANAAVASSPAYAFAHMILAEILQEQGKLKQAETAALAGVRLETENPSFYAALGAIYIQRGNPHKALEAAEAALSLDSECDQAANLRAQALTRLGRSEEAAATGRMALERDPLNAYTHNAHGWVLLEQGKRDEALFHFKEALRLDPELASARSGMLQALKARYAVYRLVLSWFFFLGRFNRQTRYAIIIGFYVLSRFAFDATDSHSPLRYVGWVGIIGYSIFAYLTWTAPVLFNTLLRFNPFGRMLLTRHQILLSSFFAFYFIAGIIALAIGAFRENTLLLNIGIGALLLSILVSIIERSTSTWSQKLLIALGGAVTVIMVGICFFL